MSLFDLFDAAYGVGAYEAIPDGIGGVDILHGGMTVDHMNADGVFNSQGAAFNVPNMQDGVDVISDGQMTAHTQSNVMGGMDIFDGDMELDRTTIPNVHGGVDIYDSDMQLEGVTMPNILGGEDYLSLTGNADEILDFQDPLIHSAEYKMDPFKVGELT